MTRKHRFLRSALILTAGTLFLRFIHIGFRSYVSHKIGTEGMGIYQLIFSLFTLASALCTSGAGFTATRLSAEGKGSQKAIRRCCGIALLVSFAAAGVFLLGADPMSRFLLRDSQYKTALRLLAPGLPFMAVCACLKGWLLARGSTLLPALAEIMEQLLTIAASVALLPLLPAMEAFMLGSSVGEFGSFAIAGMGWMYFRKKEEPLQNRGRITTGEIIRMGAPVTCGAFIRNCLSSIENLLIPRGLQANGASSSLALSQYGLIQGMVMPLLFFPASFSGSICTLLIPELARAASQKDDRFIRRTASGIIRAILAFSFFVMTIFLLFAEPLCGLFYQNPGAGAYLRIIAPIVPILYLDTVVDGMLKGLDQQMYSFQYNCIDSVLRILFILAALPVWGIGGYIAMLFFSEIFNASLSIHRLLKVTKLRPELKKWILPPASGAICLYFLLLFLRSVG